MYHLPILPVGVILLAALLLSACGGAERALPAGFSLTVSPAEVMVFQGSLEPATVRVNRSGGFTGGVTVSLVDPPSGIYAEELIIPEGQARGELMIFADGEAEPTTASATVRGASGDLAFDAPLTVTVLEREVDDAIYPMHGLVILTEFTLADGHTGVAGSGLFTMAADPEDVPEDVNPFAELTGRCFVGLEDDLDRRYPFGLPEGDELSAGERLDIYANGSVYASFIRQPEGFDLSYFIDPARPPATPLPERGLSLEVPGEDFPPFAERSFPESAPLTLTSPEDLSSIDLDTTFSWLPLSDEAVVVLSGRGMSPEQSFTCIAADTGSFSFPAEARGKLAALGFSAGELVQAGRFSYQNHAEDHSFLTLVVSRVLDLEADDDWDDWEDWED